MRKFCCRLSTRGLLLGTGAIAALTIGVTFVILNSQSQVVHGQVNLKAFPNEDFNVSIVQLLAHRDRYQGKKVQLAGYMSLQFESSAIYLSKEDADYGICGNGFWVAFDKSKVPFDNAIGPNEFDKTYVLIEGTFNKKSRGHGSAWQGTIEGIDRVAELKKAR